MDYKQCKFLLHIGLKLRVLFRVDQGPNFHSTIFSRRHYFSWGQCAGVNVGQQPTSVHLSLARALARLARYMKTAMSVSKRSVTANYVGYPWRFDKHHQEHLVSHEPLNSSYFLLDLKMWGMWKGSLDKHEIIDHVKQVRCRSSGGSHERIARAMNTTANAIRC